MIVLASTSATRQSLLATAGVSFAVETPSVDEAALIHANPEWSTESIAAHLAEAKARSVSSRLPEAFIIGADQVLAVGRKIYGKPESQDAARQQLLELRGNWHMLISSAVCVRNGKIVWSSSDSALLKMRTFSNAFLDEYLAANGSRTLLSVGGYQVEGLGIQLFESIEGNHFTILGLPLLQLLEFLRDAGELKL